VSGSKRAVDAAIAEVTANGLDLPSFTMLTVSAASSTTASRPPIGAKSLAVCGHNDLGFIVNSADDNCVNMMLGASDECECLCSFPETAVKQLSYCTLPGYKVTVHESWKVCSLQKLSCGHRNSGIVIVHGRHLRGE